MKFFAHLRDFSGLVQRLNKTRLIKQTAAGVLGALILVPFVANGFSVLAERQAVDADALNVSDSDLTDLAAATQAVGDDFFTDVALMMNPAGLKNRNGEEIAENEAEIFSNEIITEDITLPELLRETTATTEAPLPATAKPTPEPTAAKAAPVAPTPTPKPKPVTVNVSGLKPMSSEEYRVYNIARSYSYVGSKSQSGSGGYSAGWCTWYVYNARIRTGQSLPTNLGDARTWHTRAQAKGYRVDHRPSVGAAAVNPSANHVMFVEKVFANGSILVSEGGWNYTAFRYNKRVISASTAARYFYIH
ncbi:MAG: CHAP domain-containing protein [Verrucomicrobiae bacterium]|nr:CHAP domain-containing protein [Verrucomicrobiae bacterium]